MTTIKEDALHDVHIFLNKLSQIPEWDIIQKDGKYFFIWRHDITTFSLRDYGHLAVISYLIHKIQISKLELIDELKRVNYQLIN